MPLTSVEERLFAGLADQAGLVLRGARLRAELEHRAAELSARGRGAARPPGSGWSTPRTPSAARLERDIHDGAQQHLVALAVNLRLAQTLAGALAGPRRAGCWPGRSRRPPRPSTTLAQLVPRDLPAAARRATGSAAALRAAGDQPARSRSRSPRDGVGRYPASVEAAAYFCCLEALQNAAKHAGATADPGRRCAGEPDALTLDRRGRRRAASTRATVPAGAGLANMRDRVESVGGTLTHRVGAGPGHPRPRPCLRVRARARGADDARPHRLGPGRRHAGRWWSPTSSSSAQAVSLALGDRGRRARLPVRPRRRRSARAVMGALIVSRYARHPIGWLLSVVGATSAVSLLTEAYAYWVQEADGPGSAALGGVAGWLSVAVRRPARHRRHRADVPAGSGRPPPVPRGGGTPPG